MLLDTTSPRLRLNRRPVILTAPDTMLGRYGIRGTYANVCALADRTPMLPIEEERQLLLDFRNNQKLEVHILAAVGWPVADRLNAGITLATPAGLNSTDVEASNNLKNSQKKAPSPDALPTERQSSLSLIWFKERVVGLANSLKSLEITKRSAAAADLAKLLLYYDYSVLCQMGDLMIERFRAHPQGSSDGAKIEETRQRIKDYKRSQSDSLRIRDRLFSANSRIVLKCSEQGRRSFPHLADDIVSAASSGLLNSIDRYSFTAETRLYTYAVPRIQFYCTRFLQNNAGGIIRQSANHQTHKSKLNRAAAEVGIDFNSGALSSDEITVLSEKTKISPESIRGVLSNDVRVSAFSELVTQDDECYEPTLDERPDSEIRRTCDAVDRTHLAEVVRGIRDMQPVERMVLIARFGSAAGDIADAALDLYADRRKRLLNKCRALQLPHESRGQKLNATIQRM